MDEIEDSLRTVLEQKPRRHTFGSISLRDVGEYGANSDPFLAVKFPETFTRVLDDCVARHGMRRRDWWSKPGDAGAWTFLWDHAPEKVKAVREWIAERASIVVQRDFLDHSFSLDYDHEGGDPNAAETRMRLLRVRGNTRGGPETADAAAAAVDIADAMVACVRQFPTLADIAGVVAAPPSDPNKSFHLPGRLAELVAERLGVQDVSRCLVTTAARPKSREISLSEKITSLVGNTNCVSVPQDSHLLLVDDLYQSGATLNACAMMLRDEGAGVLSAVCATKACGNRDNIGGGE